MDAGAAGADPVAASADARHAASARSASDAHAWQPSALTPSQVLRRLRWVTLGRVYDWTSKAYVWSAPEIPFPEALRDLAARMCHTLGFPAYRADAGIINYYQVRDTLTGHVDRSEPNDTASLFSLSFGLDAVFLLGGATRDDPVTPILLRHGDVMLMSGACRRNYHGTWAPAVRGCMHPAARRAAHPRAHDPRPVRGADRRRRGRRCRQRRRR